MKGFNVIMVYDREMKNLLMCERLREPYKGLSNLVGGKIEAGETGLEAAYRELYEETNISEDDIELHHLMDFTYHIEQVRVEVYVGQLERDVEVSGEENILYWSDLENNFFDKTLYAGEGNIGHMIEQVNISKDKLW